MVEDKEGLANLSDILTVKRLDMMGFSVTDLIVRGSREFLRQVRSG